MKTLMMVLLAGCLSPGQSLTRRTYEDYSSLQASLTTSPVDLNDFKKRGPFNYRLVSDYTIRLSPQQTVAADIVIPEHKGPAPLVIISHGNGSYKEAHRKQAEHLASWGMIAMTLQLPNEDVWLKNGRTIAKLVRLIYVWPNLIDSRVDVNRIILAGHSFGGSAVSIAAGLGAPVIGLILLDPALYDAKVIDHLRRINVPVMVLGADQNVFRSKHRAAFFKYIRGHVGEISIKGATHNDAQYPSAFSLSAFGFDPFTDEDLQQTFVGAMTASAISLTSHQNLAYVWRLLKRGTAQREFKHPRRK